MNFVLVDPSTQQTPGLEDGIDFILFGAEAALPRVQRAGDIIRLHRVKVRCPVVRRES